MIFLLWAEGALIKHGSSQLSGYVQSDATIETQLRRLASIKALRRIE